MKTKLTVALLATMLPTIALTKIYSEEDLFAEAVIAAKIKMAADNPTGPEPLGKPLPATPDKLDESNILWTFSADTLPIFADKSFVFQNRNGPCFTDVNLEGVTECIVVSAEEMAQIKALRQWRKDRIERHKREEAEIEEKAKNNPECQAWKDALPQDYYLARIDQPAGQGKEIDFQIRGDKSAGFDYYLVDTRINYPQKPVVLILHAYYPTIWHIHRTPDTHIAAIWATGYHVQAPIGMEKDTRVLTTSFENPFCMNGTNRTAFPRLDKERTDFTVGKDGKIQIGADSDNWQTTGKPQDARRPGNEMPTGRDGLKRLIAQGALRQLTREEVEPFRRLQGKGGINPGTENEKIEAFMIQQEVELPYVAGSPRYYLDKGVPFPQGSSIGSLTLPFGYCVGDCDYYW